MCKQNIFKIKIIILTKKVKNKMIFSEIKSFLFFYIIYILGKVLAFLQQKENKCDKLSFSTEEQVMFSFLLQAKKKPSEKTVFKIIIRWWHQVLRDSIYSV